MNIQQVERLSGGAGITSLDDLYAEAEHQGLTPGWIPRQRPIMGSQEHSRFAPQHWTYDPRMRRWKLRAD